MGSTRKTIFRGMSRKRMQECGVEPIILPPSRPLTPAMLAKFYTLPLAHKKDCLEKLRRAINEAEAAECPVTVGALQRIFDDWYKAVAQEEADLVFANGP